MWKTKHSSYICMHSFPQRSCNDHNTATFSRVGQNYQHNDDFAIFFLFQQSIKEIVISHIIILQNISNSMTMLLYEEKYHISRTITFSMI